MTLNEIRDFDRNDKRILFNFDIRRVYIINSNANSEIMNNQIKIFIYLFHINSICVT